MPMLPPRPCTYPSCKEYAAKDGRCETHKRKAWNHTKASSERGYGAAWGKARKIVLARDKHLCQVCLVDGIFTLGNEVDHIKPKALGGTDSPDNLQAICTPCHRKKTAQESAQGRGDG